MWRDLRLGLRSLARTPGFTAVATLSLSLGLAAAAAAVSVLDAMGFRPLPVTAPGQLVQIDLTVGKETSASASYADVRALGQSLGGDARLAAYATRGSGFGDPGQTPAVVLTSVVSSGFFATVGVDCAQGRALVEADDEPAAPLVAVVSDHLWRRRYGADPAILGRMIELNGLPVQVIGVLPPAFTGFRAFVSPDIWVPVHTWSRILRMSDATWASVGANERAFTVLARLPPGATLEPLQDRLRAATAALASEFPDTRREASWHARYERDVRLGRLLGLRLILAALVDVVILIGCANVAGLLLSRMAARRRDLALRTALGATRAALVRQVLAESGVLALAGAALGLAGGWGLIQLLPALVPPASLPLALDFRFDPRVVIATVAASVATVLVFGLWPALAASRVNLIDAMKGAPADATRLGRLVARRALVSIQVAVSFALLVAGVLLVRSLWNSERIAPGFEIKPALLVTLVPGVAGHDLTNSQRLVADFIARVRATPGVAAVTMARRVPLSPEGGGAVKEVDLPHDAAGPDKPPSIRFNSVLPNFFATMGTRIVQGAGFPARVSASDPKVVVINDEMARRYWPTQSPVGQTLRVLGPGNAGTYTIVGVAETGKYRNLTEAPDPYLFFAFDQMPSSEPTVIIQTDSDAARLAPTVRQILHDLDPRLPTLQILTLDQHMQFALYEPRFMSAVVGTLSLLGLVLSVIGLYAVIALVVASHQREFGVRVALGAEPRDLWGSVLRQTAIVIGVGLAVGIPLAFTGARTLSGSLVGVSSSDPFSYLAVLAIVVIVGMGAAWQPARRAARIDPVQALKAE